MPKEIDSRKVAVVLLVAIILTVLFPPWLLILAGIGIGWWLYSELSKKNTPKAP